MIRTALALSVLTAAPVAAQTFDVIATMAVDSYRGEVQDWYDAHGLGAFDMTGLLDGDTMIHTPDNGGDVTQHKVELVGWRDPETDACTWGWATEKLDHLSRDASVAVQDFGTGRGLDELTEGQMTLDYQGCLDRMAVATLVGDLALIVALPYDGQTYFFGFPTIEGES